MEPGEIWNPGKHLATSRRFIAHWLLAMLSGLLTLSWMSLLLRLAAFEDVQALMTIVFAPLIGLVGAATGFYFGEKSSEDQRR
jgi:Na+/phosphate symporter